MDPPVAPGRVFRFGQFEALVDAGQLFKQGREIRLQEQPFRLLVALLEREGRIVSRQELKETLWPNGLVEFDKSLDVAMAKLRQALGDDSSSPRFIATVPRRGYQFIAPLAFSDAAPADGHSPALAQEKAPTSALKRFAAFRLIAFAAIGLIGWLVALFPHAWSRLFSSDAQVIEASVSYIGHIAPFYCLFGLGISLNR